MLFVCKMERPEVDSGVYREYNIRVSFKERFTTVDVVISIMPFHCLVKYYVLQ